MSGPPLEGFGGNDNHPRREYVVATNTGLRNWYITDLSRPLRSMTYDYYWVGRGPHRSLYATHSDMPKWKEDFPATDNPVGFYAYYDGSDYPGFNTNGILYRVTGVIEGYGRCVVGTKGFRAEVALILGFALDGLREYAPSSFYPFGSSAVSSDVVAEKRELIRDYLDTNYPEVPIFDTKSDMLRMIPLSSKPFFTGNGE